MSSFGVGDKRQLVASAAPCEQQIPPLRYASVGMTIMPITSEHDIKLAAVVGGGLGVDEEAADFGAVEFEGVFEFGDDLVDAGHREVVGEGAVAVDVDAVGSVAVGAGDEDLVDVEDLGEGLRCATKADFELSIAFE